MHSYSQIKAMLAITRASLRSILRSPSAVIFSIAFPLIFILVFGFLSSGGNFNIKDLVIAGNHNNKRKTHCPQKHEYSEYNTYYHNNKRFCKTCLRENQANYRRKKENYVG